MSRLTILATLALTMACGFVAFEMRQRRRAEERDRRRRAMDGDFKVMMRLLLRLAGAAA